MCGQCGLQPLRGVCYRGGIRQVWLNGRLCVNQGTVLDETPQGQSLPGKMFAVSKKGSRHFACFLFF